MSGEMCDRMFRPNARRWRIAFSATCFALAAAAPVAALEEPPDELPALKACEKRLCTMVLEKKPVGDDLTCDIQKTWAKSSLEGGKSKGVSWGFGDARCTVDLKLQRSDIVAALTKPSHKVFVPAHQVKCVIERDGALKPLTARVAPKLEFKNGKADKVWINLEDIEGPEDVKSTVWTAAQLEDTLGIFHRPMIKSINKFLLKQCAQRYGPGAEAKAKAKEEKKLAAGKPAKTEASKDPVKPPGKDAEVKKPEKPAKATATTP
ncbi:hypothetical protein [uncultured Hyphomicrobium sp.]|uniref:hypothetical protein n=1 Tax=uncultured Hyphomicrobium sp. TaxID=194373 RepID=UPI0025EA12E6|nr:hypothetical protein [uncultured Hyphomicrobium sp.]